MGLGHAVGVGMVPGRGGVSRGRADAPIFWGEEVEGRSEEFTPAALDPARYSDEEHTGTVGIGATAPEADPRAETAGLAEVKASGGSSAWRRRLSPHHRRAVKSFFGPQGKDGR